MACTLNKAISFACDSIQVGGTKTYMIGINKDDWFNATVVIDATSKEVTSIVLDTGAQGYKWEVPKSQNVVPDVNYRLQESTNTFNHNVAIRVNTIEQLDIDNFAKLGYAKTVWLIPLNDGRFRLHGGTIKDRDTTPTPIGVGLLLSNYSDLMSDPALGGTVLLELANVDGEPGEVAPPPLVASSFDPTPLLSPAV